MWFRLADTGNGVLYDRLLEALVQVRKCKGAKLSGGLSIKGIPKLVALTIFGVLIVFFQTNIWNTCFIDQGENIKLLRVIVQWRGIWRNGE